MNRLPVAFVVAAAMALSGCQDETTPLIDPASATPGPLDVRLETPRSSDGGVLFRLSGGPVDSVTSATHAIHASRVGAEAWIVLLVGPLEKGSLAKIWVPDVRRSAGYDLSVQQAATGDTYAQQDVGKYRLRLAQP